MREGSHRYIILFLAAFVLLFLVTSASHAMDPPHGERFACDACHDNARLNMSGATIDETPYNLMCVDPACHGAGSGMATHSSIETGIKARPAPWTFECRDCHNPHFQKQYKAHPEDYPTGARLEKGKIFSITDNVIVVNTMAGDSPNWSNDKWAGFLFQPNKNEPYLYEITGNTDDTITTLSNVTTSYYGKTIAGPGNEFGIGNTSLIKDEIHVKFPVINAYGDILENTTWRPVTFLNAMGSANSLAASKTDGEAVCVVCHTRTKALNYGFAVHPNEHSFERIEDGNPTLFEIDFYVDPDRYTHDNKVSDSRKCFDNGDTACHTGHDTGYSQGGSDCGVCHGGTGGMKSSGDLVVKLLNGNNQYEGASTNASIWAHPKHVEMGLVCDDCHDKTKGGMNPSREDYPIGDLSIFMSFNSLDGAGVLYNGRSSGLMNGFSYNGPASPGQSMSPSNGNDSMQCLNLYCHSDGGNFAGATIYQTPAWNQTLGTPTCNKCHGNSAGAANDQANYVSTDLHDLHTDGTAGDYGFTCSRCHNTVVNSQNAVISNSLHVNGGKNVSISGGGLYTEEPVGECSSVYCHSNALGVYNTANWDGSTGSLDCGGCHNQASDISGLTWSSPHTEHVNTTTYGDAGRTYQITCNACHSTVTGDGSSIADTDWHVNQVANVVINATDFGGTFNGGTCSDVKCHSTDGQSNFVTALWSDGSQGCAYCHGEAKDKATMESEAGQSPPKLSNAHAAHLGTGAGEYGNSVRLANTITCGNCHKGTTDDGKSLNTGGVINHLSFTNEVEYEFSSINTTTPSAYASPDCANVYCHGYKMPFDSNASITNQGTGLTPSWSDTEYINGTASNDCAQCHGFPPSNYDKAPSTPSTIHNNVARSVDKCKNCHSHLNKEADWPTLGQWNNIAKHLNGIVEYADCTGCHGQPPVDLLTMIASPESSGRATQAEFAPRGWGAHPAHVANGVGDSEDECVFCHLGGGGDQSSHPDALRITIGFANTVNGLGQYSADTFTDNTNFEVNSGDAGTTVTFPNGGGNRLCNNIYCHSDGGDFGGTYTAKQANWDGGALGCGDCHGNGAQYVITNAHPKHVGGSGTNYSFDCRECHFETVDNTTPTVSNKAIHVDFIKNVAFYSGGLAQGSTYTKPTCDNSYCHSDANPSVGSRVYNTPAWNGSAACGTCHGADGTDMPVSAAHGKHLSSSGVYKFECEKCHSGIVTDSADSTDVPSIASTALHVDGFPNAVLNTTDPLIANALASWNGSTCSNVYCHSDGAGTPKTQAWSGSLDCSGCHDASPTTGRHAKHLSAADGYQFECFECHNDTVEGDNITIIGNHVNKTPDVAWGNISSGGNPYESLWTGSCNNIYCHSDGVNAAGAQIANWADPNSGKCGDCHGVDDSTMPASESHILHVNTPTGNNYMYECDRCHYNIVSATANSTEAPVLLDNSVHVDGMSNVVLHTATIQAGGTGTGSTWDPATGKCTNTYCHGAGVGRPLTFGGGADTAPTWGNTSYIVGKYTGIGNTIDQDCAMCHGNPPNLGKHAGQSWKVASNDCNGCHDHLNNTSLWGTQGPWNNIAKHLNGQADGGCDGCHGNPPVDTDTMIDPPPTQREGQDFGGGPVPGWGAHAKHWDYTGGFQDCYYCHSGGGSEEPGSHPNASPYEVHMGFTYLTVSNNPAAVYNAPAFVNPDYSLASSLGNTTVNTGGNARLCSGIYCHSDGGNYGKTSFVYKTPNWDDSFNYPQDCDQCHGDGTGTGNYVESTYHPAHTGTYGYDCVLCHTGSVTPSNSIIDNATHVDGVKQIVINGTDSRTQGGSFNMPSCTVYCHSKGDDNSTFSPLSTAQWNASLPANCIGCHGNDASSGAKIGLTGTGTHLAHINSSGFGCAECHSATVSTGGNQEVTGIGNHVDRLVNVKFDNNGVNKDIYTPTYNGVSTTGSAGHTRTPGDTLGTCNNVYCHSDGNPAAGPRVYNTPNWGDNWDADSDICDNCHGNDNGVTSGIAYPLHGNAGNPGDDGSNSHPAHAGPPNNYACSECHYNTTRDDVTIYAGGYHLDGKSDANGEDVIFNTSGDNALGNYASATQKCDSTYCHGASASPAWGAASLPCDTCHGGGTEVRILPGSHGIHYDKLLATSTDMTPSNISNSTNYIFTCGVCHYNVGHTNGTVSGNQAAEVAFDPTVAGDGTYNPGALIGNDNGYNYTAGNNCTSTYCHSMGEGTAGNVDVTWGQVTNSCDNCHGYAALSTYVIGETGMGSSSHKDHINKATNKIMPDNGCKYCHVSTTSDSSTITDESMHVNVANNVGILDIYDNTAADPGDNYSSGQCTDVKCHADGKGNYGSPNWITDTIGDCLGCHGGAGGSTGTASISAETSLSPAHTVHTNTTGGIPFGYECAKCHDQVVSTGSSTISFPANHINFGPANVSMASGSWSGTNCTDTCHGTTSISWSTDDTEGDCAICHGMSDSGVTGRDTNGDVSPLDFEVGAHVVHLTAANSLTGPIACSECHPVPSGGSYVANVNGHIDYTGAEFAWGAIANGTAMGGSDTNPGYTKPTCNNVYCHGVTLLGGMDTAPTWANTSYLDGVDDCKMCHGAPDGSNGFTATNYTHKATDTGCAGCHNHAGSGSKHIDGELFGAGEPEESGGVCSGCHDPHWKRMHDPAAGITYKHYMNNALANSTGSSEADYPVVTGMMDGKTDTNRTCIMCHVEHFLFNPSSTYTGAGEGTQVREANLRVSIKETPASPFDARNSGYDPGSAGGGICLSCHVVSQVKSVVGPHGEPYTLPIPYIDIDELETNPPAYPISTSPVLNAPDGFDSEASGGIQNAVKIVRNSTHNYAVNMDLFSGGGQYQAVCLKCHGDSMSKNRQKGADLTNTLSLHQSSRDSLQAVMGSKPRGFYNGVVASVASDVVNVKETLTEDYESGFSLVITDSSGDKTYESMIVPIISNSAASVTVESAITNAIFGAGDEYEITKTATSIAEVCFNCHSQGGAGGDGYKGADGTDFYGGLDGTVDAGDMEMQDRLESMYGVFTGYNDGLVNSVPVNGTGQDDWTYWVDEGAINNSVAPGGDAANWVGYKVEFLSGAVTGQRFNIIAADGGTHECRIEPKTTPISQNDTYKILKPAFHPLDTKGVHNTIEAFTATPGWNFGNTTGSTRHVGCTDCHNTHASLSNPTGEGSLLDFGSNTIRDPDKTYSKTEWGPDRWAGYAMIINAPDASGNNPRRMVRYIVNSTTVDSPPGSEGTTFTFATDFLENSDIPYEQAGNRYELFWHDGITGSGGKGVWGVVVDSRFLINGTGSAAPGERAQDSDYTKKYDTSFDVDLDGSGLKGKQYMQCFRCHSYYAWSDGAGGIKTDGIPPTPSKGPASGGGTQGWLETDILQEFNVNNYAHHAVLGVGANQPITPDGNTTNDVLNPNWPAITTTNTYQPDANGTITLTGADALPRNVLPGWYVEEGSGSGKWYQIIDIQSDKIFTIAQTNGNPYDLNPTLASFTAATQIRITAGLGNTFVPPFGSWSVIRCSDCHGSTLSDPVGPHASVNSWLIRDAEVDLKFEWMSDNTGTVSIIDYQNSADIDNVGNILNEADVDIKYICFNCHRADVYGTHRTATGADSPLQQNLSRALHGAIYAADNRVGWLFEADGQADGVYWPQHCRHCHAGDTMGSIHGSSLDAAGSPNAIGPQAKRFLNGASWDGYDVVDSKGNAGMQCYTIDAPSTVSACDAHPTGKSESATIFNYTFTQ